MGEWRNLNDVLHDATQAETDWAFTHLPMPTRAPRRWRPVSKPVPPASLVLRDGETRDDRIVALFHGGHSPLSIASAFGLSDSRIKQILTAERNRVGLVQSR